MNIFHQIYLFVFGDEYRYLFGNVIEPYDVVNLCCIVQTAMILVGIDR